MRIDKIDNQAFEKKSIPIKDSPSSLSSPFQNPYSGSSKGLTAAERNNNPYNIKFGNFAAGYGATKENKAALDGGSFARFPSVEAGLKAGRGLLLGKGYRNLTVDQGFRKWSNNGYGGELVPELAQKRIADLTPIELDTLQRKQIVREDRNYAKKLGYLKFGGKTTKKMAVGGSTPDAEGFKLNSGMLSAGLGLAGTFVDSFDTNPNKINKVASVGGGALKGAASGASVGSVIPGWGTAVGAVVGAGVGTVTSVIKNKKRQKLINQANAAGQRNFNTQIMDRSNAAYAQLNPYQFKFGGNLPKGKEMVSSTLSVNKPVKNPAKILTEREIDNLDHKFLDKAYTKSKFPEVNINYKKGVRANFDLDNNDIEVDINNLEDVPAELAHATQLRKTSKLAFSKRAKKDYPLGETRYDKVGSLEYEAHKIIQPKIERDLSNFSNDVVDSPRQRRNLNNTRLGRLNFKFGGDLYEVERNEVVQGDNVQLEAGKHIAGNLHAVHGNTHENGGTLGTGGDRVFSHSINLNGRTPAQLAKTLGSKLKKFEPMLASQDNMKKQTAQRMTDKIHKDINSVYNAQESYKMQYLKFGGAILAMGGSVPDRKETGLSTKVTNKRRPFVGQKPFKESGNKPWNPLKIETISKLGIPITKDFYKGADLNEVVIKGKRPTQQSSPVRNKSVVTAKPLSKASLPSIKSATARTTSANPLATGLDKYSTPAALGSLTKPNAVVGKTKNKFNFDTNDATALGLSAIGYMNTANNINRMDTSVPVNLTQNPYYNYTDRSRIARADLNGQANSILNNPNTSFAQKQAIVGKVGAGINQINSQENNNRLDYDNQYNAQALQINARNNAMLTDAQQQRITNENAKLGMKSDNANSFLGNINTTLAEKEKRKLDLKKFGILSKAYSSQYGTNFDVNI